MKGIINRAKSRTEDRIVFFIVIKMELPFMKLKIRTCPKVVKNIAKFGILLKSQNTKPGIIANAAHQGGISVD